MGKTARLAIAALGTAAAIVMLVDSVSGQATPLQSPALMQPAMDTSPKPWTGKRLPDGQPDVQGGIWRTPGGATRSLTNPGETNGIGEEARSRRLPSRIIDPPNGMIPYQPWALARREQQAQAADNVTKPEHIDTQARCLSGPPRLYYYVSNYTMMQPPGQVVFMWELYHQYRVIRLDGSPHPAPNVKLWMGDSVGKWDGNTLVVDTTNLNGKHRLTTSGDFLSANAHLKERFIFTGPDTMIYEVTIEDPTVYARPWTMRIAQKRLNKQELLEERGQTDNEFWEEGCVEGQDLRPSAMPAYNPAAVN